MVPRKAPTSATGRRKGQDGPTGRVGSALLEKAPHGFGASSGPGPDVRATVHGATSTAGASHESPADSPQGGGRGDPRARLSIDQPIAFHLSWPPSVNALWRPVLRHARARRGAPVMGAAATYGGTILTDEGRRYRHVVFCELIEQAVPRRRLAQPVGISILACPPNAARRDLDNLLKATLDALTSGGVLEDDRHVDDLRIARGPVVDGGRMKVSLWTLGRA